MPEPLEQVADYRVAITKPVRSASASPTLSVNLSFGRIAHSADASLAHVLFSPMHYEPGYAYPLIVWLHGADSDERQLTRVMPIISMRNYVAIAPRGLETSDSLAENIANTPNTAAWPQHLEGIEEAERRVFQCIDLATERCHVAPQRIFLAGFEEGGTMALRLALRYPETFAGVASLCGVFPQGNFPLCRWSNARTLPTLLAVGENSDPVVIDDVARTLSLYHTAGMPISIRQYPCGQELAPEMLDDLNRWMMKQVCQS